MHAFKRVGINVHRFADLQVIRAVSQSVMMPQRLPQHEQSQVTLHGVDHRLPVNHVQSCVIVFRARIKIPRDHWVSLDLLGTRHRRNVVVRRDDTAFGIKAEARAECGLNADFGGETAQQIETKIGLHVRNRYDDVAEVDLRRRRRRGCWQHGLRCRD